MDDFFESQGYERISIDRVTDLNQPLHIIKCFFQYIQYFLIPVFEWN